MRTERQEIHQRLRNENQINIMIKWVVTALHATILVNSSLLEENHLQQARRNVGPEQTQEVMPRV